MKDGYSICFNEWALDKEIKNELGLLLIISSLCAEKGFCYANNEFFSNIFNIDAVSVSRKIKKLESKRYINIEYETRGTQIISRKIRLTKMSMDHIQNCYWTINKNVKDNNTSINNTSIKNKEKKKEKKVDFSNIKDISSYIDNLTEEEKNNLTQSQKDCINFEIAWDLYPNKKGKEKAKQYFMWYLKGRNINGSIVKLSSQQMIDATQSYADEIKKNKIELKYVKNGSTFYNYDILDYVE